MATLGERLGCKVHYCDGPVTEKTAGEQVAKILDCLPDDIRTNLPYLAQEKLRETLYDLGIVDGSASYSFEPQWQELWVHGGNERGGKEEPVTGITIQTRIVKTDGDGNFLGDIYYGITLTGPNIPEEITDVYQDTPDSPRGMWQSRIYSGGSFDSASSGETLRMAIERLEDWGRARNRGRCLD